LFGYIRPKKSELLVREYEAYRGIYCGVCKELGNSYGAVSRLSLSYDSTFYAIFLFALNGNCPDFQSGRCVANPLKKCTFCMGTEPLLRQAAALCVLLTVQKLWDDLKDHGKGHIRARFLLPLTHHAHRKAAADYPWMEKIVQTYMEKQSAAELQPDVNLDSCAAPSAEMLAEIFAHEAQEEKPEHRVLWEIGYFLGRWIYLIDAADDMQKDAKSGDFNWFVRQYGITQDSDEDDLANAREQANGCLNLTMSRLCAAFELLDMKTFAPILRNIVEQGLPEMQKQLLFKKEKK